MTTLVIAYACVAAGLIVSAVVLMGARVRRADRDVAALRRELATYTEASTNVARALSQALAQPLSGPPSETSRRALLRRARTALAEGHDSRAVFAELQLSADEAEVLAAFRRPRQAAR